MSADPSDAPERPAPVQLDNPLKEQGLVLLMYAGAAALIGLLGLAVRGTENVLWAGAALVSAAAAGLAGLRLYLQPLVWPAGAPAGILGERRLVGRLLERLNGDVSHLGTYAVPTGLVELLARALAPKFAYNTPATRHLVRLAGYGLISSAVALFLSLSMFGGGYPAAGAFLLLGALGLTGFRAYVLYGTVPDKVPETPVVRPIDQATSDAGNPREFVNQIVLKTTGLRTGDETRLAFDTKLENDPTGFAGQCKGFVSFETPPVRVRGSSKYLTAARQLEYASAGVALLALAVCALAPTKEQHVSLKVAALLVAAMAAWMAPTAFRLRNTFRFTSDLVAVWISGTYQSRKDLVAAGTSGGLASEAAHVKSMLRVRVLATRVVSECTLGGQVRREGEANVAALESMWSALTAPRYIVRAEPDEAFEERIAALVADVLSYRDVYRDDDAAQSEAKKQDNAQTFLQQELVKHQLAAREQIVAKALAGLTPEQALQMLATGGGLPGLALPGTGAPQLAPVPVTVVPPPAPPPAPPASAPGAPAPLTPAVEKMIVDALKLYLDPNQTEAARAVAKQMLDNIKKAHNLRSAQLNELANKVRAELKPK